VAYGLIAAIAWGTSAVAATLAARRTGIYVAVLSAQGLGLALLLLLAIFVRPARCWRPAAWRWRPRGRRRKLLGVGCIVAGLVLLGLTG
jgi:hypothetical protein